MFLPEMVPGTWPAPYLSSRRTRLLPVVPQLLLQRQLPLLLCSRPPSRPLLIPQPGIWPSRQVVQPLRLSLDRFLRAVRALPRSVLALLLLFMSQGRLCRMLLCALQQRLEIRLEHQSRHSEWSDPCPSTTVRCFLQLRWLPVVQMLQPPEAAGLPQFLSRKLPLAKSRRQPHRRMLVALSLAGAAGAAVAAVTVVARRSRIQRGHQFPSTLRLGMLLLRRTAGRLPELRLQRTVRRIDSPLARSTDIDRQTMDHIMQVVLRPAAVLLLRHRLPEMATQVGALWIRKPAAAEGLVAGNLQAQRRVRSSSFIRRCTAWALRRVLFAWHSSWRRSGCLRWLDNSISC